MKIGTDIQPDHYLWVGAGDLTGDGRADIFALTVEEQGYIFLNRGGLAELDTLAEPVHIGGKLPDVAYDTIALADMNADGKTDINGDGRPDLLGLRQDGTLVAHAHSGAFDPEDPTAVFQEPVVVAKGWHDVTAIS
ncbi:FG-GAP-like repeat-containing protein [Streptomyces hygroscopicus]|uniref:FG-GAP-like repeat-containing protein n=1 Tax=Streptomyces hygroscopicus TaxID=1912 RepID=UPI003633959C